MAKSVENKMKVKQALADKCMRLATVAGSVTKRTKWLYDARRYRAQVEVLQRKLEQSK